MQIPPPFHQAKGPHYSSVLLDLLVIPRLYFTLNELSWSLLYRKNMVEDGLIQEIKSGKVFPLYLLFGPEEYLIEDTLRQAVNVLLDPVLKEFNFNAYHAESCSPVEVLDTARTLPSMSKHRVVVVRKLDNARQTFLSDESLLSYLDGPYQETCLFFTAQEVDKRKKFFALINKKGKIVHFPKLKSRQASIWILKRAKSKGRQMESEAADYLSEVCNNNLQRIDLELEKIITYAGEENLINLKSVQLVAGNIRNESIFALTDAIGKKDMDCSLGTLDNLLYQGGAPLRTLGMITRQFRLIWQAKTLAANGDSHLQISKKTGIPSYFVGKILSQAREFSLENLYCVFERLLQADLELKSSGKSPIRILESLVIDLCLV